jgi:2-oxoglutarate ferredoxin oxidoreductase subunit gamma
MQHTFLFAGSGGQGVMFAGQLLAYAGMAEGLNVTWIPSYGPEMRGGTAHCFVTLSDRQIGSPVVPRPEVALLFNQPSLDKYEPVVAERGILAVNTSLAGRLPQRSDVTILAVPATDIAESLGNARMANLVLLGAALSARVVLPLYAVVDALKEHLPARRRDLLELNIEALARGSEFAQQTLV